MYRDQVVKKPSGDTVPLINNRVGFREHGFPLSSQQFICTGSFLTEYSHIGGFFYKLFKFVHQQADCTLIAKTQRPKHGEKFI